MLLQQVVAWLLLYWQPAAAEQHYCYRLTVASAGCCLLPAVTQMFVARLESTLCNQVALLLRQQGLGTQCCLRGCWLSAKIEFRLLKAA